MYYNFYQSSKTECDECTAKGICSINPTLTSLQEVIILHLKELSFYLVKLKELGVTNDKIKEDVLDVLSGIIINAEYTQEQLSSIIKKMHDDTFQAKELYKKMSEDQNLDIQYLKTYFKHQSSTKFSLSDAIKRGEKYFLKKQTIFTSEQKNLFDIMLFLIKSMSIKLIELKGYNKSDEKGFFAILTMLNMMNFQESTLEEIKNEIELFVAAYYEVVKAVYWSQVEAYGEMEPVEVSFSTRPGKAILVAGSNLQELETVLKETKNKGIDVYTHGIEMLMAHSFPRLRAYPNLMGHFGSGTDSCIIDFATFPGAILMTRHSLQKVEYLYQGRLFTSDLIAPRGITKIFNKDYGPLIEAAMNTRGFSRGLKKPSLMVGYSEKTLMDKLNTVLEKIDKGEIKHFYIIGLLNDSNCHREYFEEFIRLIPDDCFVLSLAYDFEGENILHIKSFYEYSLIYRLLKRMTQIKPLGEFKMSIFVTKCDKHIIANILNLKILGVKNVYMCKCSPMLVNPALINALRNIFGVNEFFDPKEDIKKTLLEQ